MPELTSNEVYQSMTFDAIKIGLASPDRIREWAPDCIIPVPIHPERRRKRGYNQAEDIARARELSFAYANDARDFFLHTWFMDPAILGVNTLPYLELCAEDISIINQPVDFMGINIYNGKESDQNGYTDKYQGFPRTALGWPVTPRVMNYGLRFLYERYNTPIIVTECGVACNDRIYEDGRVHDSDRIDFLSSYIKEMENAIKAGTDIRGFFHWSLMDNLEWSNGYDPRFGLIYTDYRTLKRIPKDSAEWYSNYIKAHR